MGSLSNIDPTKGYWIRLNALSDYEVSTYQTSIDQIYQLHEGQNLISYIGLDDVELDSALPDDIELLFTDIFSENVSATRNENGDWVGSLAQLGWQQLLGYWVNSSEDVEFSYEINGELARYSDNHINEQFTISSLPLDFGYNQSQNQSFYYFKNVTINNEPITEDDWIIAYHNDIIVGARKWFGPYTDVPAMGYDGFYETIGYCEENSNIVFKVYKYITGEIVTMDGNIPLWSDKSNFIISNLYEEEAIPKEYSLSNPYPNPFNPIVKFDFSMPETNDISINVYDIKGRKVDQIFDNHTFSAGYHNVSWNASLYSSGIYFIRFESKEFNKVKKVTLLK